MRENVRINGWKEFEQKLLSWLDRVQPSVDKAKSKKSQHSSAALETEAGHSIQHARTQSKLVLQPSALNHSNFSEQTRARDHLDTTEITENDEEEGEFSDVSYGKSTPALQNIYNPKCSFHLFS